MCLRWVRLQYLLEFKVIDKEKFNEFKGDVDSIRRNAIKLNNQSPKYEVEISAYEYVEGATTKELDGVILRVYTLEMILFEKIRALCQTMPEYSEIVKSARPKHRARDIYDIFIIFNSGTLNLHKDMLSEIFKAKQVPLEFINNMEDLREHNRENWETVRSSISESDRNNLKDYDYYFDEVLKIIEPFKTP